MAKTFEVLLTKNGDELLENITLTTGSDPKKLKTRKVRGDYRNAMKDPQRFDKTHMSDRDHPSVIMRRNDDVSFFYARAFTVGFFPDPEVELEIDAVPCPFFKNNNVPFNVPQVATATGGGGDREFKAGPFKMRDVGEIQRFYKFTVWTEDNLILDPDIVCDL